MGRRKLDVPANSVEVANLDEDAMSYCLVRHIFLGFFFRSARTIRFLSASVSLVGVDALSRRRFKEIAVARTHAHTHDDEGIDERDPLILFVFCAVGGRCRRLPAICRLMIQSSRTNLEFRLFHFFLLV